MTVLGNHLELDRCPYCGVDKPSLPSKNHFETNNHSNTRPRIWKFYVCGGCGGVVSGWQVKGDPNTEAKELFPPPREVEAEIPDRAKEYLSQALSSLSAPAGAVMLAA